MKKYFQNLFQNILASYAKEVIDRYKPFVIAIAGSVGKTSTKEAIYAVISNHYDGEVRKSEDGLNGRIGLMLTILGYKKVPKFWIWPFFLMAAKFKNRDINYPKYLILEMGIDGPDDMDSYGKIVQPDIGVITGITNSQKNFKPEEWEKEVIKMIKISKTDSKILINLDDAALSRLVSKAVTVGVDNHAADYLGEDYKKTKEGSEFRIKTLGQSISIKSAFCGKDLIYPQVFAFAVGQILGIQSLEIKKYLEQAKPGRGGGKLGAPK